MIACAQCGKESASIKKFCNRRCYERYYSAHYAGVNSKHWKGGKSRHNAGYVKIRIGKGKPMADQNGDVLEHRYLMSQWLKRPLVSGEVVHHINGDRADNRMDNLELFTSHRAHQLLHASQRTTRRCMHCERKHYAKGLCSAHYEQQRRYSLTRTSQNRPSASVRR